MRVRILLLAVTAPIALASCNSHDVVQKQDAWRAPVTDDANLLSVADEQRLTGIAGLMEARTGRKLIIATVVSLRGRPVEDVGDEIGNRSISTEGVVLLVAPNERQVRISVSRAVNKILTNEMCARIIADRIGPRFRAGDYPGGIVAGAESIVAEVGHE